MTEADAIRLIHAGFPRPAAQRNLPFECDAELLALGNETWALTVDEFSPAEDRFHLADRFYPAGAELLGANLATATLSDLLAAGAVPELYLHAVCLPRDADERFVSGLADGIRGVLEAAGCRLCGGDMGSAAEWRYTGFAMGRVREGRALTHVLAPGPLRLWVTGRLGDANAAAAQGLPAPRFETRVREAGIIHRHAASCIDTSSGFLDALWLLHAVNPARRIEVRVDRIPLDPAAARFGAAAGIPAAASLIGGAGEYELVFATPEALSGAAEDELAGAGAVEIGGVSGDPGAGLHLAWGDGRTAAVAGPPPCPRAAADHGSYVKAVLATARALFEPR